jgi:DNA-binding winged helix-turn-helix (wHTH) protein/tetratricopeptide (TPR) repeat protein
LADSSPTRSIPDPEPTSANSEARGAVDLTLEPDFTIGGVRVSPRSLRIMAGGGPIILQRRVMQVLVVLHESQGQTVSHETLTRRCWDRRFVGEDAIQRCVAGLRRLGEATGAFSIETLSRVGYRLMEQDAALGAARAGVRRPRRLTAVLALAGAALVLAIVGLLGFAGASAGGDGVVQVQGFDVQTSDPDAADLARGLKAELVDVLNENQVPTTSANPLLNWRGGLGRLFQKRAPTLLLTGDISKDADQVLARVRLLDGDTRQTIWSMSERQAWARRAALREVLATATNEAVQDGRSAYRQPGFHPDAETVGLFIRGSAALQKPQFLEEGSAERLLQMAVDRAPNFAAAHAALAVAICRECKPNLAEEVRSRGRARAHAQRAIALDPRSSGAAFDALYLLARRETPQDLARAERYLLRGLAAAPDFTFLSMRACSFQLEVGRTREALRHCRRALELRPLAFPVNYRSARALYAAGQTDLAAERAANAARRAPDHERLRFLRLEMAMYSGPPALALAMLRDPRQRPQQMNDEAVEALTSLQRARASGAPADAELALSELGRVVLAGSLNGRQLVLAATLLHRPDIAFAALNNPQVDTDHEDGVLFLPTTAALRRDPRFWPVAERLGLVRYWRQEGKWPDLCRDPKLRPACERVLAVTAASTPIS